MKAIRTVSRAAVAGLLVGAGAALTAWAGTNNWTGSGPAGGDIRHVEFKPDDGEIAYATAPAGLYQSTDGGVEWAVINSSIGNTPFAIDPLNPEIIYFVDVDGGLKRSADGGTTIEPVDNWIGGSSTAVDVGGPGTSVIYAGTESEGVVRSNDGGASWHIANGTDSAGLPTRNEQFATVDGIFIDPTNAGVAYATYSSFVQGVYRTKDAGVHWFPRVDGMLSDTGISEIAIDPTNSDNVYAATDSGLYYSTDQGENWHAATMPVGFENEAATSIVVDPALPTTLFAGGFGGVVFVSSDSGQSFTLSNTGMSPSAVHGLATHDGVTLLAATSEGVSRSTNSGSSWEDSDSGIVASKVVALASDPELTGTLFASTTGIHKSTHAGTSWTEITDIAASSLLIDPNSSAIVYAAAADGVEKSVDGGVTWFSALSGVSTDTLAYSAADASIYALDSKGPDLYRTIDGGATWTTAGTSIVDGEPLTLIVDEANAETLYLGTAKNGAFKSVDGGATFDILTDLSTGAVTSLAQDPTNDAILFAATDAGVLRTKNSGTTWKTMGASDLVGQITIVPSAPEILYGTSSDGTGILRSLDSGASWATIPPGGSVDWHGTQTALDARVPYRVYAGTDSRGVQVIDLAHDLQASVTGPDNIGIDVDFQYVSTITNAGPGDAPRVTLTQTLPIDKAAFVSAQPDQGSCEPPDGAILNCDLGTLAEGATTSVLVTMTSADRGLANSRVTAASFDSELSEDDNTANAPPATITRLYDLVASVTAPATAHVGDQVTYTASATNDGPNDAKDITIVTEVPDGATFFSADTDLHCTRADAVLTCTGPKLAAGESAQVAVTYDVDETGSLTATMNASAGSGTDDDLTNNDASATTQGSNASSGGGGGGGGALDPLALFVLLAFGARRRTAA